MVDESECLDHTHAAFALNKVMNSGCTIRSMDYLYRRLVLVHLSCLLSCFTLLVLAVCSTAKCAI